MPQKSHKVDYKKGVRFIEVSKRSTGIENWPELNTFTPGNDFPSGEAFINAIADGDIK